MLEPYRMGMSPQAERSVMEFMVERRYLGLPQERRATPRHADLEPVIPRPSDSIENRGFVAGLVAVGGVGLVMLVSNKIGMPTEIIAVSLGLIASVSLLIVWPMIKKHLSGNDS